MHTGPQHADALLGHVLDVARIEGRQAGYKYGEQNLSGHLLLVALHGKAKLDLNGFHFPLVPGAVAWLQEAEWLRFTVLTAPWTYLQVRFTATHLPHTPHALRVRRLGSRVLHLARELHSAWKESGDFIPRSLLVAGLTGQILGRLLNGAPSELALPSETASLWWRAEAGARKDLARPRSLAELCALAGTNRVALEAAAREATGLTPIRRLKQIRLLHAQTLMRSTNLLLKEIALSAGYARLQDFSRDYRHLFGLSPRKHRARGYEG